MIFVVTAFVLGVAVSLLLLLLLLVTLEEEDADGSQVAEELLLLRGLLVVEHRSDLTEVDDGGVDAEADSLDDAAQSEDEEDADEDEGDGSVVRLLAVIAIREVDHVAVDDPGSDDDREGQNQQQGPGERLERVLRVEAARMGQ